MGFLKRVFGSKEKEANPRDQLQATVDQAVSSVLMMNFTMLGWEPFSRSLDAPEGSKRSCGYLLGLGEGVIAQFAVLAPTEDEIMAAFAAPFSFVFGETAAGHTWARLLATIDEFQAEEPEVVAGFAIGRQDVDLLYSGGPYQTPLGFWRIHNPDAV